MKKSLNLLAGLALALLLGTAAYVRLARADESVNAKLLALFPQFDADHDASLSPAEQARAVEFVQARFGSVWAQQVRGLFKAAAAADGTVAQARWIQQAAGYGRIQAQTYRVAMRDGSHLATDVFLPAGAGPFPVVLSRTPYGRQRQHNQAGGFVNFGLAFVVQDMRGRFDSEGENLPFVGCGWGEHQDGVDTLAWLRRQPWCNGKIGTVGGSAGGITQNLLAGAAPGGLAAQYISVAAESLYNTTYIGGAFRKADVENWTTQNKFDPQALLLMHAHASYDAYWRTLDTTLKYPVMDVPAVHQGGWFDMFAQATLNEFVGRQHQGAAGGRGRQKLVMGPWDHGGARKEGVGELHFPNNQAPAAYSAGPWFAHYLGGETNSVEQQPAVAYYVMGDTATRDAPGNRWRFADDWPVPARATPFYFARSGQLGTTPPAETAARVEYTFSPADPCPTVGGNNLTIARGPRNQNAIEKRGDVVLFTTAPLAAPVEVTGRVTARLFIESSAADTDFSVRLCDVYPDGKSYLIAEGMARARYRQSPERAVPLTPGQMTELSVDCWSTSIIFNTGHCIRATVTSSNYPRFDLNPGTGQPWSAEGVKVPQTNRIYCDAAHASCLILPVVAPQAAAAH